MLEPRTIRVFLSAVSDEFHAYRDLLRSDLTRQNLEVKVQEDFNDLGGVTLEKLDTYIKLCDAVVHLVGDMTGEAARKLSTEAILGKHPGLPRKFPPPAEGLEKGEPISFTQWEAWLALYHGKVLLIRRPIMLLPGSPGQAATSQGQAGMPDISILEPDRCLFLYRLGLMRASRAFYGVKIAAAASAALPSL